MARHRLHGWCLLIFGIDEDTARRLVTLTLAAVLALVLINWRFGKEQQWRAEKEDRKPLPAFLTVDENGDFRLVSQGQKNGEALSITKGFGIFFDKGGMNTPMVFSQFINKLVSMPEVSIFFHMRSLEHPTISANERFVVSQIRFLPHCYRVVCRHGYMDEIITPDLASVIYGHVRQYVLDKNRTVSEYRIRTPSPSHVSVRSSRDPERDDSNRLSEKDSTTQAGEVTDISVTELQQAFEHRVLYVVGKEEMHVRPGTALWRKIPLKSFLFMRENTRNKMANLKVPTDRLVEIGFVKEV